MSRKNAKSDQSAELFVKAKLFPIIVIVEFIALVLSFNHNILSLKQSFYNNPYLVLTIVFVSASTFLYYSRLRKKIVKIFLFIAFCLIFAGSVCYHIWGGPSPAPKPDPWRPSHLWHLGSLLLLVLLLMVPIARADTKDVFKIAGFYIDDKRCSYYEDFEEGCVDSQKYRTFRYNQDVRYAFDRGECNGVTGNQPITNLIPLLKKRVERLGRRDLEEYFNTQEKFSRLMTQKGDLFKKIMFTDDEIDRMKSDDVISYGIIKEWLVSCVGVIQPVLTFNIQNTTNQDILITRIVYDVSAVCGFISSATGSMAAVLRSG